MDYGQRAMHNVDLSWTAAGALTAVKRNRARTGTARERYQFER